MHPTFFLTLHPQNEQLTFGNRNVPSYRRVFPTSFPRGASACSGIELILVHRELIVNHLYFFHMAQISHLEGWICCRCRILLRSFFRIFWLTLLCVDSYLEEIEEHHIKGAVLLLFPNLPQSSFGYVYMTLPGNHYLHDHGLNPLTCLETSLPANLSLDCWKSICTNISGYKMHYISVTHSCAYHADDRKGVFTFEEHTEGANVQYASLKSLLSLFCYS